MILEDSLIKYFPDPDIGLGDILCTLSVLLSSNVKVQVEIEQGSKALTTWNTLVKIFNLESKVTILTIDYTPEYSFIRHAINKFNVNSPYIDVPQLKIFDSTFKTQNYQPKGAIGIVKHNGMFYNSKINFDEFPGCRYYSEETWQKIICLIRQSGRDVIELNNTTYGLENKTFIVNNIVDAIIGCDNGVAHLAHILKIPYIMLPWQTDSSIVHKLHIDSRTHFLQSVNDICTWTPQELDITIYNLQKELGNNIFLNPLHKREVENIAEIENKFIAKYSNK